GGPYGWPSARCRIRASRPSCSRQPESTPSTSPRRPGSWSAPPSARSRQGFQSDQPPHPRKTPGVTERQQVEAVRRVEEPSPPAGTVGVAELPDDPARPHVDHDDPFAEIVVDRDQALADPRREGRVVELAGPGTGTVPPDNAAALGHHDRLSRAGVIGQQDPVAEQL